MRKFIFALMAVALLLPMSVSATAIGNLWPGQQVWNMPPAVPPDGGARLTCTDRDAAQGQDVMFQLHVTADVFPYLEASISGQSLYWEIIKPGQYTKPATTISVAANAAYTVSVVSDGYLVYGSSVLETGYAVAQVGPNAYVVNATINVGPEDVATEACASYGDGRNTENGVYSVGENGGAVITIAANLQQ